MIFVRTVNSVGSEMLSVVESIASIIAAALGVGAAIFGVWTYFQDRKRSRKKDTLDAYDVLQKETFDKINTWLPSEIKQAVEDKKSDEYKELSGYLANIDRFCIGINEGIYDFDTFYKLSHGYFDNERGILKPRLIPLIESKIGHSEENYFQNIHDVWKKMDRKSISINGR